jgi:hypothetical protein
LITRLGNQLTNTNIANAHLTNDKVLKQVALGLNEFHKVVFLGDLEYLTNIIDPHTIRLPYDTNPAIVKTAHELDNLQLKRFCWIELNHL